MFTETAQRLRSAAPLLAQTRLLTELGVQGGGGRRHLNVSARRAGKVAPRWTRGWKPPKLRVHIPGLEQVTYMERMHYVPGLAKPTFPTWERTYRDPWHLPPAPPQETMPLYKHKPCHVFNQRTRVLEGVKQALWLTKSKLIQGLPGQVLALAEDPANQIQEQDERVQRVIKQARFWDTTEDRPARQRFCGSLLQGLLHLCAGQQVNHPELGRRLLAENYSPIATWNRGEDLFQVRGKNGLLLSSAAPLPVVAGKEEVQATSEHVLETFYPISPTIDLTIINLYEETNRTGFREGYPYPHAHTLFILEDGSAVKLLPDQLRAKLIMFAFGNALARAHAVTTEARELERPIVVQAVGTNGRVFHYVVFQLNTTALQEDAGVKNLVWVDEDQPLYEFAKVRPVIKKKVVQVPAGLAGYEPQTFQKFLSLYLHGAVGDMQH